MRTKFLVVVLVLIVASLFVSFAYTSTGVAAGGDFPVPDDSNKPIPAPWPEEPGKMPDLIGGRIPDRPRVYSEPSPDKVDQTDDLAIDVWYGNSQKFGQLGNPQEWVNIVGNVSGFGSGASLSYKLNGDPQGDLSIGPNGTRLEEQGDFNIEIKYADLDPGNQVEITASDGMSETKKTVTINYTAGQTWDSDYTADWSSSSNIQDIAQVVDGNWKIDGDSVYIDEDSWGYDRLLAIGDETWTDYEVTVPITVYGLDPAGNTGPSNGMGVGIFLRWQGHNYLDSEQPREGFERLGGMGWYRWFTDSTEALELRGWDWRRGTDYSKVLEFGTEYIFKMSVQSIPDSPAYYRLKFWKSSQKEPNEWDLQGYGSDTATESGSVLLVAHHVDAKFGQVTVKDLNGLRFNVNVTVDGEGTIIFNPDQEDFAYSERVRVAAIPEYGYDFDRWTGDYTGTANPADFRIYRDMNLTAHFVPKPPAKLEIDIVGNGTVVKDPNKSEYPWGEEVTLTANPAGDQIFLRWEGDLTGILNPVTLTMDEDKQITAVFGPKSEASPQSDDFSGCVLDTDLWDVVNPAADATLNVTGRHARFSIPAGSVHNMWNTNSDALRIMQPTEDQNFELVAKFQNLPVERFQMQGILIQQNANNWLRFDVYHNGSSLLINAARTINGASNNIKFAPIDPGGSTNVYIRVERNGDKWTHSYSFNGTDWTTSVVFIQELTVNSSGVFVGNSAQTPGDEPAFVTRLDYFFNTANPIIPEDEGNTVDVFTVGQGQVQVNPVKNTYDCNEKVTLTATPANDWLFFGWSGDLSGGTNPATLTVTGDHEITAIFGQQADVFLPSVMRP